MTKRGHSLLDSDPASSVPSSCERKFGIPSSSLSAAVPAQEACVGDSTGYPGQPSKRLEPQDRNKLFEWMAEPFNFFKVMMAGDNVGDIHQEAATFVNKYCHTDWTKQDACVYIQYITRMYNQNQTAELSKSIGIGNTDEKKLSNDTLYLHPHFSFPQKAFGIPTREHPDLPVKSSSASVPLRQASRIPSHVRLDDNHDRDGCGESSNDRGDSEVGGKPEQSLGVVLVEGTLDMRLIFHLIQLSISWFCWHSWSERPFICGGHSICIESLIKASQRPYHG